MADKNIDTQDQDIFYNTMSLGWHLKQLMLAQPELFKDSAFQEKFFKWLQRHNVI